MNFKTNAQPRITAPIHAIRYSAKIRLRICRSMSPLAVAKIMASFGSGTRMGSIAEASSLSRWLLRNGYARQPAPTKPTRSAKIEIYSHHSHRTGAKLTPLSRVSPPRVKTDLSVTNLGNLQHEAHRGTFETLAPLHAVDLARGPAQLLCKLLQRQTRFFTHLPQQETCLLDAACFLVLKGITGCSYKILW
jgi:hypothetical protein